MSPTHSIQDIGELRGPLLVFGGVYSNLQALQALQQLAREQAIPPPQIICTGDIVAYCAQPEECVQLLRDWGIHCIAGNVEVQLREGEDDCACDFVSGGRCESFSQNWYPYARIHVSEESIKWMHQLPDFIRFRYAGHEAMVLHGSYHHMSEFIFASTPWATKARNFADTATDLILAGHCGLPFSETQEGQTWINAGVIGMPANDGTPRVWYAVLRDEDGLHYEQRAFTYDHTTAAQLMRDRGLPSEYAHTLETGIWDNCEILPAAETARQGIKIQ